MVSLSSRRYGWDKHEWLCGLCRPCQTARQAFETNSAFATKSLVSRRQGDR
jgi:hypothetical protein